MRKPTGWMWPDGSGMWPDGGSIAREGDSGLGLDNGTQI
jgi:hypothetical protein